MSEEQARNLIAAYLSGNITESDRKDFEVWIQASEANRMALDEARRIWEHSSARLTFGDAPTDEEWERLWSRIDRDNRKGGVARFPGRQYLKFAAAIVFLVVAYFAIRTSLENPSDALVKQEGVERHPEGRDESPADKTQDANDHADAAETAESVEDKVSDTARPGSGTLIASELEVKHIYLPDSSSVWLNANSSLSYSPDFGQKLREVVLEGEGYFEVTPDTGKKFIVRGKEVRAVVLGTAFDMVANDSIVTVTVAEGKVAVIAEGIPAVNLVHGEKAVRVKSGDLVKSKNADPRFDAWRSPDSKVVLPEKTGTESSLAVEFTWKKNDVNQSVVTGVLRNGTDNVTFSNITLKITMVKSNGKEVTNHVTVYETILPGESTSYRTTLMDMFTNTKDLKVEVEEVETITTPVR